MAAAKRNTWLALQPGCLHVSGFFFTLFNNNLRTRLLIHGG
jgi:hypothetical protein